MSTASEATVPSEAEAPEAGEAEAKPPVLAPAPGLDLRSLHIETSAVLLRDWAAATIAEIFDDGDAPAGPGRLAELKLRTWHWRRREAPRLERWFNRPLLLSHEKPRLTHPISLLLIRHLKTTRSWWWRWLPGRLRGALSLAEPHWPPSLWPAISTLAWREPRFQRAAAEAVFSHFRRTRLMPGAVSDAPVFRPQAWWLVLDLIGVPALGRPPETGTYRWLGKVLGRRLARAVWRRHHSGRALLRDRLSEIARGELFGATAWAGFWEQWLVGEAMLRHPELVVDATKDSRQVLALLPLLGFEPYRAARNRLAIAAPKALARQRGDIVDPQWRKQKPEWFLLDGAVGV